MDYESIFAISAAGMASEKTRVQVAAMNIANAQTVATGDGSAYQPMRAITRSIVTPAFGSLVEDALSMRPQVDVVPDSSSPRKVYEPSNPLADTEGFITYPSVDTIGEMVRLLGATRAYESNVVVLNTARSLALKTLEIGGGS